jgi:hypothetical protein
LNQTVKKVNPKRAQTLDDYMILDIPMLPLFLKKI